MQGKETAYISRSMTLNHKNHHRSLLSQGQKKLKKRHEKSVVILVLIVAVFVLCHSFRLGVQTYQVIHIYILKILYFLT